MYIIDVHVHTRDFRQVSKKTIDYALRVARNAGVSAILAMPNINSTLSTERDILDYKSIAQQSSVNDVYFGFYMVVTKDREQIKKAAERLNLPIGGFTQLNGVYGSTAYPFNVWIPLERMLARN